MPIGIMITFIAMNPVAIWKRCIHCSMVPLTSDRIANSTPHARNRSSATFTWPHCIKRPAWMVWPGRWKINPVQVKPFSKRWYSDYPQPRYALYYNQYANCFQHVNRIWTNNVRILFNLFKNSIRMLFPYYAHMLASRDYAFITAHEFWTRHIKG